MINFLLLLINVFLHLFLCISCIVTLKVLHHNRRHYHFSLKHNLKLFDLTHWNLFCTFIFWILFTIVYAYNRCQRRITMFFVLYRTSIRFGLRIALQCLWIVVRGDKTGRSFRWDYVNQGSHNKVTHSAPEIYPPKKSEDFMNKKCFKSWNLFFYISSTNYLHFVTLFYKLLQVIEAKLFLFTILI